MSLVEWIGWTEEVLRGLYGEPKNGHTKKKNGQSKESGSYINEGPYETLKFGIKRKQITESLIVFKTGTLSNTRIIELLLLFLWSLEVLLLWLL